MNYALYFVAGNTDAMDDDKDKLIAYYQEILVELLATRGINLAGYAPSRWDFVAAGFLPDPLDIPHES